MTKTTTYKGNVFEVDAEGFLADYHRWDRSFADWVASELNPPMELSKEHWDVINFIRNKFAEEGRCPLVYETCRQNGLSLDDLTRLFPSGYLRGACRMAGITYREGYLNQGFLPSSMEDHDLVASEKSYQVDVRGFLANPDDWDEYYAAYRAYDMKLSGGKLTEKHWQIIKYLRESYRAAKTIPTIYETCLNNGLEIEELEKLFPDGYHRGLIKIAGLQLSK
jgi:tRNA 2-thiouridine synthesizing protein E